MTRAPTKRRRRLGERLFIRPRPAEDRPDAERGQGVLDLVAAGRRRQHRAVVEHLAQRPTGAELDHRTEEPIARGVERQRDRVAVVALGRANRDVKAVGRQQALGARSVEHARVGACEERQSVGRDG